MSTEHAILETLFMNVPSNQFLPLVQSILSSLTCFPDEETIVAYCIGASSTNPTIASLSKKRAQTILFDTGSYSYIPYEREERLTLSIDRVCDLIQTLVTHKEEHKCYVLCWIFDHLSTISFEKISSSFEWCFLHYLDFMQLPLTICRSYLLFLNHYLQSNPDIIDLIYEQFIKVWSSIRDQYKMIKGEKDQQVIQTRKSLISQIITICQDLIHIQKSKIIVTPAILDDCLNWMCEEMESPKNQLHIEFFNLASSLHTCFYDRLETTYQLLV